MKESCEKINQEYESVLSLILKFKKINLTDEKLVALKLYRLLKRSFMTLREISFNNIYNRKRLADKFGYACVGLFDEDGIAIAYYNGFSRRLINKKGEPLFKKDFSPLTPFKNGYSVCFYVQAQVGDFVVINKQGEILPDIVVCYNKANEKSILKDGRVLAAWSHFEEWGNIVIHSDAAGTRHFIEKDSKGNDIFHF